LLLFFVALTIVPTGESVSYANDAGLQSELNRLNQQISSTSEKLKAKQGEVHNLSNQVDMFDGQIQQLELQIEATQKEMDLVNQEIADTNQKIKDTEMDLKAQKATLFEYLRVIYEEGNTSTLELIVVSNNFSDFVDKAEYLQVMQMKVNETVERIKTLKLDLDKKKGDLVTKKVKIEGLKKQQWNQKQIIDEQKQAKASLLGQAQGQAAGYQAVLKQKKERAASIISVLTSYGSGGGGTFLGVPFYSQLDYPNTYLNRTTSTIAAYGCGVSSIAMLLSSYGYAQTPATVGTNSKFFSGPRGTTDMLSWYNIPYATGGRFRILDNPYAPNLAMADAWASRGKPFIVYLNNAFGIGLNHFVVIVGSSGGKWIMSDPVRGGGISFDAYYSRGQILQTEFVTP